jgi:hypothetical protein
MNNVLFKSLLFKIPEIFKKFQRKKTLFFKWRKILTIIFLKKMKILY